MDELLKKLLESEILTEDTKKELESAIKTKITEAVEAARKDVETEVRQQLAEQWVDERSKLIEGIDAKIDDLLNEELSELKSDIERFRDLEAEAAEKSVVAEKKLAEQFKTEVDQLVDKLDNFLEIRLNSEIEELKEDIVSIRKKEFGKKLFEAFAEEFKQHYFEEDGVLTNLRETEKRLSETLTTLSDAQKKLHSIERNNKLREVLAPLSGRQKDIMGAILNNVPTEQLEEGYKTFISRVLKESTETTTDVKGSEKETKVLAEQKKEVAKTDKAVVITGDAPNAQVKTEVVTEAQKSSFDRLKVLSGIK